MDDEAEALGSSNSVERECPECGGTCYDEDDAPCRTCFGEGVLVSYGPPIVRGLR